MTRLYKRKWIQAALILALLVPVVPLVLWLLLPGMIESRAVGTMEENGIEVQEFTVGRVGLQGADILPGELGYMGNSISWKDIKVHYQPLGIYRKKVDRVEIESPELRLDLNRFIEAFSNPLEGQPAEPVAGTRSSRSESRVTEPSTPEEEEGEDSAAMDKPDAGADESRPGTTAGTEGGEAASPWDPSPIFKLFSDIPLTELFIHNGKVNFLTPGEFQIMADWSGDFLKTEDVLNGKLEIEGDDFAGSLIVDGMKSARYFSARSEVNVYLSQVAPYLEEFLVEKSGMREMPVVTYPEKLSLDVLLETVSGNNNLGLSGEASMGEMQLDFVDQDILVPIDSVQVAGSTGPGQSNLSAGIRFGKTTIMGLESDPFGMTLSLDQAGFLAVESEMILSRNKDWSAKSAFRGRSVFTPSGAYEHTRLEWSFSGIQGPEIRVEDFSFLLENSGKMVQAEFSPVGFRRNGTMWIEKGKLYWDLVTNSGKGGFDWFNTAGAYSGSVTGTFEGDDTNAFLVGLQFINQSGNPVLNARYGRGDRLLVEANGSVPLDWINGLTSWWGSPLPGRFNGEDMEFHTFLNGRFPFLRGSVGLSLMNCSFVSNGGTVLEGIQAAAQFKVNMLPKTLQPQEVRVQSVRTGKFTLKNCLVVWEMPLIHRLLVKRAQADFGDGKIWINPFRFNPLNPEFETEVFFSGVRAGNILDLLDEKRFSVEGALSGSLKIGWKDETVLLGEGQFRIDPASTGNWFRFLDPAFVDEHLSNLGSAPEELKERFRDALLRKGIRLDELEVTFRSADESGQVSLRISLSGETKTDLLEIPIGRIVINNLISEEDLAHLLDMWGSVRMMDQTQGQIKE